MKKLKYIVKEDFENKLDRKLSFDNSLLDFEQPENKKIRIKKIVKVISLSLVTCLVLVVAVPLIVFVAAFTDIDEHGKLLNKNYTINEVKMIESSSFKKLNEVVYPSIAADKGLTLDDDYINAVKEFSYNVYDSLEYSKENMSFSPFGLYSNLSIMATCSNVETVNEEFNNLLGLNKEIRKENYKKAYLNDYFVNESGTLQMYNGLFADSKYEINNSLLNDLTDLYVEAYSLDLLNDEDVKKMLSWVDQKVDEKNFLEKKDLEIDEYTALLLMSTLYFDNKWATMFSNDDTYSSTFNTINDEKINVEYMIHSYFGKVYRYEKYDSFYDYYKNGCKVQYITPRSDIQVDENIYELLDGVNFFNENEENVNDEVIITLSVPKFDSSSFIDFSDTLKDLGLMSVFNKDGKAFNNVFTNLNENDSIFLKYVKQKNVISFNEDGTTIKSVSFGGFGASSAGPMTSLTVKLDRPFVYVIYDPSGLPIYIGNVDTI